MPLPHRLTLATLLLAGLPAGHACAAEKPLWEPGAGVSTLCFPDYRAGVDAAWILGESSPRVEAVE